MIRQRDRLSEVDRRAFALSAGPLIRRCAAPSPQGEKDDRNPLPPREYADLDRGSSWDDDERLFDSPLPSLSSGTAPVAEQQQHRTASSSSSLLSFTVLTPTSSSCSSSSSSTAVLSASSYSWSSSAPIVRASYSIVLLPLDNTGSNNKNIRTQDEKRPAEADTMYKKAKHDDSIIDRQKEKETEKKTRMSCSSSPCPAPLLPLSLSFHVEVLMRAGTLIIVVESIAVNAAPLFSSVRPPLLLLILVIRFPGPALRPLRLVHHLLLRLSPRLLHRFLALLLRRRLLCPLHLHLLSHRSWCLFLISNMRTRTRMLLAPLPPLPLQFFLGHLLFPLFLVTLDLLHPLPLSCLCHRLLLLLPVQLLSFLAVLPMVFRLPFSHWIMWRLALCVMSCYHCRPQRLL